MILIAKFKADWHTINHRNEHLIVPDIEREVWYDPDTNTEEIYFSPEASRKISESIDPVTNPNYKDIVVKPQKETK